jgi:serine protease Do
MHNTTKKIILWCTLFFSLSALTISVVLVKHHASLLSQIKAITSQQVTQAPLKKQAPARVISEKNGTTWLDVQRQVKDTVVQVFSHVTEFNWIEPYKSPELSEGTGSGFFINDNGDIVTNYHVIAQASDIEIQIPSFGYERFDVKIIGVCPERDIALLTLTKETREKIVKQIGSIPFLTLGDSDDILRSQEVLALGYPLGQSRLKSTLGIVSGRERLGNAGFIQITAPLNPGNSGGPALDTNGNVIGINSRGVMDAQNVGYIIPINEVKSALKDLYKVKLLRKPTLGCIFTDATPELVQFLGNPPPGGWYIAKVFEGTLLESVGIKEGDMLYEVNGYKLDTYGDLIVPWSEDKASLLELLTRMTVGDQLHFVIYRHGTRKDFKFNFEHKYLAPIRMIYPEFEKEAIDYEIIGGMVVMQLSINHIRIFLSRVPDLVRYGKNEHQHEPALVIANVLPNSQAYKARVLRPGNIIEEVNGQEVKTLAEFRSAILESKKSRYITIKTDDNFYGVMSVDKLSRDEDMLAARYLFEKSPLVKDLTEQQFKPQKKADTKAKKSDKKTPLKEVKDSHKGAL